MILLLSACFDEEQVDVYTENEFKTVIEAVITNTDSIHGVSLFQTTDSDEHHDAYPISNAGVFIQENGGEIYSFAETSPGQYEVSNLTVRAGNFYTLLVSTDKAEYIASDTMPAAAIIDSTNVIKIENNDYYEEGYYVVIYAQRPGKNINYYKVNVTVNDTLYSGYEDLIIIEDSFTIQNQEQLLPYAFKPGDQVTIDIYSITEGMYNYYYGIAQLTTNILGSVSSPIINPVSNISNNSLGYFQVSTVVSLKVTIK